MAKCSSVHSGNCVRPTKKESENWLISSMERMKTTAQVAKELNLSRRRILQAAQSMGLEKLGRDYLLTEADIAQIRKRIGKRGRPSK